MSQSLPMILPPSLPSADPQVWTGEVTQYDRFPALRPEESAELGCLFRHGTRQIRQRSKHILQRLLQPIHDVLTHIEVSEVTRWATYRVVCMEMFRRESTFWVWSIEEWRESLCTSQQDFYARYGWHPNNSQSVSSRSCLPALLYFLRPDLSLKTLLDVLEIRTLAVKIFGAEAVAAACRQVVAVLESWGYQQQTNAPEMTACLCYLLLVNRSPHLSDLAFSLLEETDQTTSIYSVKSNMWKVSRALVALGITPQHLGDWRQAERAHISQADDSLSEEWLAWCQRWQKQSTLQRPQQIYYTLLKVGRWLKAHHPEVTRPSQWTYELAADFVAAVNAMKVGEWSVIQCLHGQRGKPLRPTTKARLLNALRTFIRDCQEWGWIPVHFTAQRALRPPPSIRNQLGPDPRVVDKDRWAKLLWAALNLQVEDLPPVKGKAIPYPIEMVRAVALIWCFAALRSDEIVRLRLGCVRWQYEDVRIPETGDMLPRDAVCFLDIPVNKTLSSYTKAVHPLVGKRINEWEQVRPKEQPAHLDGKTGEWVHFLFTYRGGQLSKAYLNRSLIPHLCRKAGIPEHDSRGPITSHRARASIASQLYNAKEPLTLFELKDYLGHKSLTSTQFYARVDPTKLASRVVKAGYLEQNLATIEVLLDQDAVRSGAAARGETWKYYDLGHGWCTNDFWAECKHRMACARCPFYRPKNSMMDQLLEGKANLMHMREFVRLTEEEKALVTEGIELHQDLIEGLVDTPTPTGPTPRELEKSQKQERNLIPLNAVHRTGQRQPDT